MSRNFSDLQLLDVLDGAVLSMCESVRCTYSIEIFRRLDAVTMTILTRPVRPTYRSLSPPGGQDAWALVTFPVWRKVRIRAMRCLDDVPAQNRSTWNEVDLLLSEMVLRLAHVEECRWSTEFWFCFRLPDTLTDVSTISSKNCPEVDYRLSAGDIAQLARFSIISAKWSTTNPSTSSHAIPRVFTWREWWSLCGTVSDTVNERHLGDLCLSRHLQSHWNLPLYRHGHV